MFPLCLLHVNRSRIHLIAEEIGGTFTKRNMSPIGTLLYNVLGVVIFMGVAWIYWDRYEKRERLAKAKLVVRRRQL